MSGVMQSPQYPGNYPENVMCQWVIELPPQYKITLEFTDFQLEKSTSCQYDFVLVMGGPPSSPIALGKFCGNESDSLVESNSNVMTVLFKSDTTKTKKGFEAYWYAQPGLIDNTPSPTTSKKFPSGEIRSEFIFNLFHLFKPLFSWNGNSLRLRLCHFQFTTYIQWELESVSTLCHE